MIVAIPRSKEHGGGHLTDNRLFLGCGVQRAAFQDRPYDKAETPDRIRTVETNKKPLKTAACCIVERENRGFQL